jgi:hypothetical protein
MPKTNEDEPVTTMAAIMPKRTVHEALAAVAAAMPAIGKDRKSPEGYNYRGIEDVTASAGPLLARHGVVIVPSLDTYEVVPTPAGKDGWTDVRATFNWFVYGPDGSSIEARTMGIGRDRSDKGSNKAQTQAYKYLLFSLLSVADSKDDAEHNPDDSLRGAPPARRDPVAEAMTAIASLAEPARARVREVTGQSTLKGLAESLADPALFDQVKTIIQGEQP